MARLRTLYAVATLTLVTTFFLFALLRSHEVRRRASIISPDIPYHESRLHFLIVATSSGLNLCRLLLSASVLAYPPPVLIDWEGEGEYNAAETHLAKIAGPIRYLESLPSSKDDDIVLLVDGFDVFLQLGPDVILRRYFEATAAATARLAKKFGEKHVREHKMYNSILFGPDKMCWPLDFRRPACWAVPESSLPRHSFGPQTDRDMVHARPRWLNSGTIMGPVAEMRELFLATRDKANRTWDPDFAWHNSDQMYFSDVWADQEYARMVSTGAKAEIPMPHMVPEDVKEDLIMPQIDEGTRTELHMGLDYASSMFQTFAGYKDYLTWVTFNQSTLRPFQKLVELWRADIQDDVLASRKPFSAIKDDAQMKDISWRDVSLGINTVTGLVFPLLHFTGEKEYRDLWWTRMWYFPEAKRLLHSSAETQEDMIGTELIHGTKWLKNYPFNEREKERASLTQYWSDQGEALTWDHLCKNHEAPLFTGIVPDSS